MTDVGALLWKQEPLLNPHTLFWSRIPVLWYSMSHIWLKPSLSVGLWANKPLQQTGATVCQIRAQTHDLVTAPDNVPCLSPSASLYTVSVFRTMNEVKQLRLFVQMPKYDINWCLAGWQRAPAACMNYDSYLLWEKADVTTQSTATKPRAESTQQRQQVQIKLASLLLTYRAFLLTHCQLEASLMWGSLYFSSPISYNIGCFNMAAIDISCTSLLKLGFMQCKDEHLLCHWKQLFAPMLAFNRSEQEANIHQCYFHSCVTLPLW